MANKSETAANVTQTIAGRGVVPFTSGVFAIYAFFWPESFGTWFGTIIHAIRTSGGF